MLFENAESIGKFLLEKGVLTEYDIQDNGPTFKWFVFTGVLQDGTTLELTFYKEGILQDIKVVNTLDLLKEF